LLFIKRDQPAREKYHFFIVNSAAAVPAIYEYALKDYNELLDIDPAAVLSGSPGECDRRDDPLILICTNGTRDKCCAKFGRPLYDALYEAERDIVWQSTHIGGHRYAPNVLFLPHSINYGLLSAAQIGPAAVAYRAGAIYDLAHFRGRTTYPQPVQAAEYFLRQALVNKKIADLPLAAVEQKPGNEWQVTFHELSTAKNHQITLNKVLIAEPFQVSCSPPKSKPLPRYQLLKHTIE
jgi:hypothetical protein